MSYEQALEEQVRLLGRVKGPEGARLGRQVKPGVEDDVDPGLYRAFLVRCLEQAEPYYWSAEIGGLIDGLYGAMPEWTLRPETLSSTGGFFWFSRPFDIPCGADAGHRLHTDRLAGLLWLGTRTAFDWSASGGVALVPLVLADGRLEPLSMVGWGFGWHRTAVVERWSEGGPLRANLEAVVRVFACCQAFIAQRLLVAAGTRAPRGTRRRAAAALPVEPLVRVVALRRRDYAHPAGGGERDEVAWSCRWIVSGHWRRQYYPSCDEHRPVFIDPYMKGDPEKPLKPPRGRVFAVVR